MGNPCVVGTCKNSSRSGIQMHGIPFFGDERPEAKRRRKRWVDFVKSTRKDQWKDSKHSQVCSQHFKPEDYQRLFSMVQGMASKYQPRLKTDSFELLLHSQQFDRVTSQKNRNLNCQPGQPSRRKIMKDIAAESGECITSQQEDPQMDDPAFEPPSVSDTTTDNIPIQEIPTSSPSTSLPQKDQQPEIASYMASTL